VKRVAFPPIRTRYVATDEYKARPRSRILLALRRFDWIDGASLNGALNLPTNAEDGAARNAYTAALRRLVLDGFVLRRDRDGGPGGAFEYRLAPNVDLSFPAPSLDVYECQSRERQRIVRGCKGTKDRLVNLALERRAS
jgi:hypothetical protein